MDKTTHITISQAAKLQKVSRQTIYNWIKASGFPVDKSGPWPVVCVDTMNTWRESRGLDPVDIDNAGCSVHRL